MPNGARARSRSRGLLSAWAGESPWRRLVAWLVQGVILVGVLALALAVIWFILTPWMIDGITNVFQRR
jgi:hypothetical protein